MHETGEPYALIVRKGTFFEYMLRDSSTSYLPLSHEEAIRIFAHSMFKEDIVVSTTGMISRGLFEYRESVHKSHERDFLTVDSMGHASRIALAIALIPLQEKFIVLTGMV